MAGKAAMEVPEKALGIDLGTTYTCVGFWKSLEQRVEIITNEQGNRTTPSMVAFTAQETLVGQPAMNQYNSNPQNSVFDAKRLIGRRFSDSIVQSDKSLWPFQVVAGAQDNPLIEVNFQGGSKRFKPEEISSMILKKMKDTAQGFLQCEVNKAVITVPAYFSNSQRQATRDAGRLAGLQVLQLLNEPTAAAIAYSLDTVRGGRSAAEERVVVYDLGGGTFDVAVLKISGKNDIVVKAVKGDTHLGGQDFDNRLLDHFVQEFARKTGVDVSGNPKALRRLRNACERAKRELSSTVSTIVDVPCLHESQDFYCTISRAKFEQLNMDLFQRTTELVVECIHDALLSEADIDSVLLVGGSSRIPKLQQLLKDLFPKPVALHRSINPDEAVAYGAAIKAAELTGARSGASVVKDVTPLSLGILTRRKIMTVLIPRNTHIPVKKKDYFKTKYDNQRAIRIDVYEGERTNATDNLYLNGFSFTDLPPAPKGEEGITIAMEIDHDGILTVTAEHQSSNRREQLTVTSKSELLKQNEIENLVTKAGKFSLEDQEWKDIVKLKNKLDDDIYDAKKRLSNLRHVVDTREVAIHLDFLEQLRKSLDDDNVNLDMKQLQQKKSVLQSKEEHVSQLVNNSRKPSSSSLIGRVFGK